MMNAVKFRDLAARIAFLLSGFAGGENAAMIYFAEFYGDYLISGRLLLLQVIPGNQIRKLFEPIEENFNLSRGEFYS